MRYWFSAKSSSNTNPKYRRTDEEKLFYVQWNSTFVPHQSEVGEKQWTGGKTFFFFWNFVIIMDVTFLIEFRLRNFSLIAGWKMFVKGEWLIVFHLTFHYISVWNLHFNICAQFLSYQPVVRGTDFKLGMSRLVREWRLFTTTDDVTLIHETLFLFPPANRN